MAITSAVLVAGLAWVLWVFNRLIRKRNEIANARAQIEVQLTRRYELIPNLTAVAERYMRHEEAVFAQVAAARNQALETSVFLPQAAGLQLRLGEALRQFLIRVEAYPELKADAQMQALQEELRSTENRIAFARQYFNDAVTDYNDALQVFPDRVVARLSGFREQVLLGCPPCPWIN